MVRGSCELLIDRGDLTFVTNKLDTCGNVNVDIILCGESLSFSFENDTKAIAQRWSRHMLDRVLNRRLTVPWWGFNDDGLEHATQVSVSV